MIRSKMKVLVVDDFSTMRRIIKNLLRDIGFDPLLIDEADDGRTGIDACINKTYDLVLSDWNMPGVTGIEFLKWVRSSSNQKEVPFILITAEQKRSQILEAAQAGVDNYIVKPFTSALLNERINKVLERKNVA